MTEAVQLATTDDLHAQCWEAGALEAYLHSGERGQVQAWERMWRWYLLAPAEEQARWSKVSSGPVAARIFCLEVSRRWGKSALCLWWLTRLAVLLPPVLGRPAKLRYTTMFQHSIDTIVGEVMPDVFRHAPPSCTPQYHGKRGTLPAGLYWPAEGPMRGSRIAMAGLEVNPKALRGQGSDSDVVSEAGFIDNLEREIKAVMYAQYQRRPWARMVLESSAPDREHTSWERVYLPDAKLRGAHFVATIDDNPLLSAGERDEFVSAAGGRGAVECEREYYNVIASDPTLKTFPELGPQHMLGAYEQPAHAITFTALDPGHRHLFALLFAVYDPARGGVVIVDCWAESNASTERVAAIVAAREWDLWGTWPAPELARIPLRDVVDDSGRVIQRGWDTLLAGDRCARHAEALHRMATTPAKQRPDNPSGWPYPHWRRSHDYDNALTYYDHQAREFRCNPYGRVSDIEPQMIHDMLVSYGLAISPTTKDDLRDTMVWFVRQWLTRGRIAFTQRAQLAFDHVKACVWNKQRTAFDEHPTYGHFDLAAALVYLCRYAEMFANINPEPPPQLGVGGPDWAGAPQWQTGDSLPSEMF